MQANSSQPATADIRQFLTETFSDEELSTLCFDYFRDVYDDLASGMTKGQKIQMLIERCERRGVLPNLLTAIQRARPEQYKERFPQVEIQPEHPRLERDPRQVFISHAHQDANFAHRLAKDLQKHGWRLWIAPDSIRPGEKWGEAIDRGLDESGVFVVALTPAALQSRWVRDETYAAIELEKKSQVRFVPLYVKPCNVPHLWGTYQHISFSSSYASGLKELLAELEPPETVEPAPPPAQSVCVADETSRKQMPVPSHPSQPPAKRMMERLRFQFAAILSTHPLRNKLPFLVAGAGILAVALVVVLVSAVMSGNKGIATPTPVPTHPAITSTGSIVAVLATDIPLSNATPEPTFTEVPKPATNIPTPTPTVLSSTPVPLPAAVISTTNVTQITQLARWGKGKMTQVAWAPDGQTLALAGSLGIHFYEAAMLRETSFIETQAAVYSIVFSPDGKTLASGNYDKTVKLWDVTTGRELRTFSGHTWQVNSVAFSPDGKMLASASNDSTIKLWDVATGRALYSLGGDTLIVTSVAFSPDGKTLASGNVFDTVTLWDVATGRARRTFKHTSEISSLAFSPDGNTLASEDYLGIVKLWDVAAGHELYTLTRNRNYVSNCVSGSRLFLKRLAFSPDGNTLVSAIDQTITLWNVANGHELRTLDGQTGDVLSVAFSPDGKALAWVSDNTMKLQSLETDTELRSLGVHIATGDVAFSPDTKMLASGDNDCTVKLWDVATGRELYSLSGHTSTVTSIVFSPDGKTVASGSYDNSVILWNAAMGQELHTLTGHTRTVESLAFSLDSKTLASASNDNTIKLWDVATGRELRTLSSQGWGGVASIAFSPDSKTLVSGHDNAMVKLWDVATGRELRTLRGHTSNVVSVAFSPDGKTVASGSAPTIKLWDVARGIQLYTLSADTDWVWANSLSFSPDGKLLASADSKAIRLWDTATGRKLLDLKGHTDGVQSITFSSDGKLLASRGGMARYVCGECDSPDETP